jgi:ATP-dependent DNA helicase RecG
MDAKELMAVLDRGEDSSRQFKANVLNGLSFAQELVALSNANGGEVYIGVADDGSVAGLAKKDISRLNQLVSNAASQMVRLRLILLQKMLHTQMAL